MNKQDNNQLDILTDRIMESAALESPSKNFTDNVMSGIQALDANNITTYKPLISKKVWFSIAAVVIVMCTYIIFENPIESIGWFSNLDFNLFNNYKITTMFSNLTVSKTFLYSIVLFGAMLFVQLPILKNYFDNRLEL